MTQGKNYDGEISSLKSRVSGVESKANKIQSDMDRGFSDVRKQISKLETDIRLSMESLQGSLEQMARGMVEAVVQSSQSMMVTIQDEEEATRSRIDASAAAESMADLARESAEIKAVDTSFEDQRKAVFEAIDDVQKDLAGLRDHWEKEVETTVENYRQNIRKVGEHIYPLIENDWEQTLQPRLDQILTLYEELKDIAKTICEKREINVEENRGKVNVLAESIIQGAISDRESLQKFPDSNFRIETKKEMVSIPILFCSSGNAGTKPSAPDIRLLADGVLASSSNYSDLMGYIHKKRDSILKTLNESGTLNSRGLIEGLDALVKNGAIDQKVKDKIEKILIKKPVKISTTKVKE
jgi:hypothetical protein